MDYSSEGVYYGNPQSSVLASEFIITEVNHTPGKVGWHYHENAFFSLLLNGKVLEANKKREQHCLPGTLLFQYWQEPHYNHCIKPAKGFYIELKRSWLDKFSFGISQTSGSVNDPDVKILFYKLYKESRLKDGHSAIAMESLLVQALAVMSDNVSDVAHSIPLWAKRLAEILHSSDAEKFSLTGLAAALDIHPVHLCRQFPKYFHCTLGEYTRKIKVERSHGLLLNKRLSLTQVALQAGFSDQSHFTRSFKEMHQITPLKYRKIILGD